MSKFVGNSITVPRLSSAPSSPVDGDLYYNTGDNKVYGRVNGAWVDLSASGNVNYYTSTAPSSGNSGDIWIDSDDYIVGSGSIVDSVTSTSTTTAASSNAVKLAYDSAVSSGNALLNGAFDIWQRGTSFAAAGYTADRWYTATASGQTLAASQQSFTPGTAPVSGYESAYFLRNAWSGTPSGFYWLTQRVEDVRTFAGQTVTLSYWAKSSSSTSALSMAIEQNFGTGGSSIVTTTGSAVSLTTSWQRFSQTFSVPSISGKTIGTSSYLDVRPFYSNTSVNGLTIDIWGVQLESGSVATPFKRASANLAAEIQACYRYYYKITPGTVSALFAPGYVRTSAGTTTFTFIFNFPTIMRTAPSALETTGTASNYEVLYPTSSGESSQALTAVPVYSETGVTSSRITGSTGNLATGAGGVGSIAMLRAATTTTYLAWSAEF